MPTDLRKEGINSPEDLELLMSGDIVNLKYPGNSDLHKRGAICLGLSSLGVGEISYKLAYQTHPGEEEITLLISNPRGISFQEGTLVVFEDYSFYTTFTSCRDAYKNLKELLIQGGIWENAP